MKYSARIVALFAAFFCTFSAKAQHARTEIQGYVLTFDRQGNRIGYPFEYDAIQAALVAEYLPISGGGPIRWIRPKISEDTFDNLPTARFVIDVSQQFIQLTLKFEYGRYIGSEERVIHLHVGDMPLNIDVYETASSDEQHYQNIKSLINKNLPNIDELDQSMRDLVALFSANHLPRYLMDLPVLVSRILQIEKSLTPSQARIIESLPYESGFGELTEFDKFRLYSEIGYAFLQHADLDDFIESSYTHAEMGQEMLSKAIEIYETARGHSIPAGRIAHAYQAKYKLECLSNMHHDCFNTISEFLRRYRNMNRPTYLAFLNDYTTNLAHRTFGRDWRGAFDRQAAEKVTDSSINQRFWAQFYCTGVAHGVVRSHISETPHLEDFLEFSNNLANVNSWACPSVS